MNLKQIALISLIPISFFAGMHVKSNMSNRPKEETYIESINDRPKEETKKILENNIEKKMILNNDGSYTYRIEKSRGSGLSRTITTLICKRHKDYSSDAVFINSWSGGGSYYADGNFYKSRHLDGEVDFIYRFLPSEDKRGCLILTKEVDSQSPKFKLEFYKADITLGATKQEFAKESAEFGIN